MNVPRLASIAGKQAFSGQTLDALQNGFPRGRSIIRELYEVDTVLRQASILAVDVEDLVKPDEQLLEGLTIYFYRQVWAKNAQSSDIRYVRDYSFKRSPQIYFDSHGYRYVFPFDPLWLTTNTAQCLGGSTMLAGIGIIKSIDHTAKCAMATPLTFGIPNVFEL